MPLPGSGQITLDQMHVEAGGTSGTQASINDSDIRSLIGASSGQANLSFSDFYGASSSVTINITISSNTNNYNLWDNKGGTYSAGNTIVNLTINSGVTIGSTSSGTYAFTTGLGWVAGDVINITNNGTIKGKGGNGGAGGNAVYNTSAGNGGNGGTGSPAFRGQFACTVTNNGSVYGGGGGGGGGGSNYGVFQGSGKSTFTEARGGGGGGGGAGVTASSGGAAGTATGSAVNNPGSAGSAGTATAGGAGGGGGGLGAGAGGNGGGLGSNGSAGTTANTNSYVPPGAAGTGGGGGTRGYYQVGSVFINGGSGIGGTVGGRSA